MNDLFLICCIAVVLMQAGCTVLRFSLRKLQDAKLTVISNCIKGALVIAVLAVRYVPQVSDRLETAMLPGIVELGFKKCAYLVMFLLLTCLPRMLLEHFVLKMPYKRTDWIMLGVFILLGALMFRSFLF